MAGAASSALVGSVLYKLAPGLPFVIGGAVLAVLTVVAVTLIRGTERSTHPATAATATPIPGSAAD